MSNCDKKFAVESPIRQCMPTGGTHAFLGIKGAVCLLHGSQGCATYMRFQKIRDTREPINNISSTSMVEQSAVHGGEDNLLKALNNIVKKQSPELIGVFSTCLSATIGDDIDGIIDKFKEDNKDKNLPEIISVETPSYAGNHTDGYNETLLTLVKHFTGLKDQPNHKVNIVFPCNCTSANIKEIKSIVNCMGISAIYLTDTSNNLDPGLTSESLDLQAYGTSITDIADTCNSLATISFGSDCSAAGIYLSDKYSVDSYVLNEPIGLVDTDSFIRILRDVSGNSVPESIVMDRDRLKDTLVDSHSYNHLRKVAVFGDSGIVNGVGRLVSEMGMVPSILCTSGPFDSVGFVGDPVVLENNDLYDLSRVLDDTNVDLLIGNSYGNELADKYCIPLFRVGFPIFDRVGSQRIRYYGYDGGIDFVDRITNLMLDTYYDHEGYDKVIGEL